MNAIVLAGGKATRLNGCAKGLLLHQHRPIIEHICEMVTPFVKQIIISANSPDYDYLGYVTIQDKIKDIGPLGGIISTLEFSAEEKNIILSCDIPFVNSSVIQTLIEYKEAADIIIPKVNENIHPLCAIYSKTILPLAYEQVKKKDFKLKNLVALSNTYYIDFPPEASVYFTNINTTEDLKLLTQNN